MLGLQLRDSSWKWNLFGSGVQLEGGGRVVGIAARPIALLMLLVLQITESSAVLLHRFVIVEVLDIDYEIQASSLSITGTSFRHEASSSS